MTDCLSWGMQKWSQAQRLLLGCACNRIWQLWVLSEEILVRLDLQRFARFSHCISNDFGLLLLQIVKGGGEGEGKGGGAGLSGYPCNDWHQGRALSVLSQHTGWGDSCTVHQQSFEWMRMRRIALTMIKWVIWNNQYILVHFNVQDRDSLSDLQEGRCLLKEGLLHLTSPASAQSRFSIILSGFHASGDLLLLEKTVLATNLLNSRRSRIPKFLLSLLENDSGSTSTPSQPVLSLFERQALLYWASRWSQASKSRDITQPDSASAPPICRSLKAPSNTCFYEVAQSVLIRIFMMASSESRSSTREKLSSSQQRISMKLSKSIMLWAAAYLLRPSLIKSAELPE